MEVGHDKEEELQQDGMVLEDVTATGDEEMIETKANEGNSNITFIDLFMYSNFVIFFNLIYICMSTCICLYIHVLA